MYAHLLHSGNSQVDDDEDYNDDDDDDDGSKKMDNRTVILGW